MNWKVRGIRGATTASDNTEQAIGEAVRELLDEIETQNELDPEEIVSATFTATPDLDAVFPAAIARQRPHWQNVPLLDVQQMQVKDSLPRCIRVLIHINTPKLQKEIHHSYLRGAYNLRPDLQLSQMSRQISSHVGIK